MTNCNVDNEAGRSMTEILGVLAIIGVLSVTAMTGFRTSMAKLRANELLNEANKRALAVASQITTGDKPSLDDFPTNNKFAGGTFEAVVYGANGQSVWAANTDKQFTLSITGVSEDVCIQLKQSLEKTVQKFSPDTCDNMTSNTVKLTYNNDLTPNDIATSENTTQTESCPEGETSYCAQRDGAENCTQRDCCSGTVTTGVGINGTDKCCSSGETGYCYSRDNNGNCTYASCCSGTVTRGTDNQPDTCS